MHLGHKKMPLLVPLLEPVVPRAVLGRRGSLLPWSMASQYATAKAATAAGHDNGRPAAGQQDGRIVDANGLRAGEHDVKLHGTRRNRTSSAVSGDPTGSVHNSRGGNRGFFQNRPPPDGPRSQAARLLPVAFAHAPGNGMLADVGAPCLARWPDTDTPPAAATKDARRPRRLDYSTAKEDAAERTTSHIPSRDKSANDNASELAIASKSNHAEPRT